MKFHEISTSWFERPEISNGRYNRYDGYYHVRPAESRLRHSLTAAIATAALTAALDTTTITAAIGTTVVNL